MKMNEWEISWHEKEIEVSNTEMKLEKCGDLGKTPTLLTTYLTVLPERFELRNTVVISIELAN